MEMTAVISAAEEGGFVALNKETGTTTRGETLEDALANLKEATAIYHSEFPLLGAGQAVVTSLSGTVFELAPPAAPAGKLEWDSSFDYQAERSRP